MPTFCNENAHEHRHFMRATKRMDTITGICALYFLATCHYGEIKWCALTNFSLHGEEKPELFVYYSAIFEIYLLQKSHGGIYSNRIHMLRFSTAHIVSLSLRSLIKAIFSLLIKCSSGAQFFRGFISRAPVSFYFLTFSHCEEVSDEREEIRNMWLPSNWNRCTFLGKYVQTHRRRAEPNSRVLLSLGYVRGAGSILQTIYNLRKKWESMSEKIGSHCTRTRAVLTPPIVVSINCTREKNSGSW